MTLTDRPLRAVIITDQAGAAKQETTKVAGELANHSIPAPAAERERIPAHPYQA